jgi:hypothetical protein
MAWVPLVIMAAGMLMQAEGSSRESKAKQNALEYNAEVNRLNANKAIEEAEYKVGIEERQNRRIRGKQEALFGKTGTAYTGSALDVMADQAFTDEMNLMAIRYGGESSAYTTRSQAALYEAQAKEQGTAGDIKTLGTIATGAGKLYTGYSGWAAGSQAPSGYSSGMMGSNPFDYYGD